MQRRRLLPAHTRARLCNGAPGELEQTVNEVIRAFALSREAAALRQQPLGLPRPVVQL